jgi:hypothetical protein
LNKDNIIVGTGKIENSGEFISRQRKTVNILSVKNKQFGGLDVEIWMECFFFLFVSSSVFFSLSWGYLLRFNSHCVKGQRKCHSECQFK